LLKNNILHDVIFYSLTSKDLLTVGVLQMIVGTGPYVKYSENIVGSKLVQGVNAAVSNPFAVSVL
jgi:hypothetical protein